MTKSTQKELTKDEQYWKVIEFLNEQVSTKKLDAQLVLNFKTMIRDNKYVSTYVRALRLKMEDLKSIDDLIKKSDNWSSKKPRDWDDLVDVNIRNILENHLGNEYQTDPIKIIHNLVVDALEREGKICDFRDSINPYTKIGRCESDRHYENVESGIELSEEEQKKFDEINHKKGYESACLAFDDKFNPSNQELNLTLYQDDDTSKFNDNHTEYVCQKCLDDINENGDCEVSCDMD